MVQGGASSSSSVMVVEVSMAVKPLVPSVTNWTSFFTPKQPSQTEINFK
jgi:hypothetical protein